MTTKREAHGVQFTSCPECSVTIGARGLARHRKSAHGVAPTVAGGKRKALTTGQASALRYLIANGTATVADVLAGSYALDALVRAGFATHQGGATYAVTEAGRNRLPR